MSTVIQQRENNHHHHQINLYQRSNSNAIGMRNQIPDSTMKGKTIEYNRAPPPPQVAPYYYNQQQKQHQQQHHQKHNYQQQQQPASVVPQQSRIPTVQNFNQISKTATNLLNDIYEKHLLSQTKFEYGNNGGGESNHPIKTDFNLNNAFQQLIKQKDSTYVITESLKNHNQLYETVDTVNLTDYNKHPNYSTRGMSGGVGCMTNNSVISNSKPIRMKRTIEGGNSQPQPQSSSSLSSAFVGQKYFRSTTNECSDKSSFEISSSAQRSIHENKNKRATPIGGNHTKEFTECENGSVRFEYRNSKINLMLETAQAIAAAAYFAR